jgi:aspartyl-tRNA(Asn)/glutamyl-tRNA(Gln) amidotransferase subunit A
VNHAGEQRPSPPPDPSRLSATRLAALYRAGALSPVEVFAAVRARAARLNPRLNAIIAEDPAGAEAAARASEARWRAGAPLSPLDGVPFTVKDNIAAAGLPCGWGSPLFAGRAPAAEDELPAARLRAAGLVLLGKTNVPEFTSQGYTDNPVHGATRNPWDLALTPGGSSGGAVAAVAAGLGPLALGTDGGGSIRRPASHTGLVGLKPTPGRVPRADGLPAILLDCEQIGPIARTVADLVAAMARWRRPTRATRRACCCRLSRCRRRLRRAGASASSRASADTRWTRKRRPARRRWRRGSRGSAHAVEEGPPPFDADAAAAAFGPSPGPASLGCWTRCPAGRSRRGRRCGRWRRPGGRCPRRRSSPRSTPRAALRRRMAEFFAAGADFVLTPAAAALPWPARESHPAEIAGRPVGPRGHAVFTAFANLAGLPGIAFPGPPSAAGLPIGVQVVGPAGADGALCALAAEWERASPWAHRWPALD